MVLDEYDPDTYDSVKHRIKQRFTNRKNKLLNVKLSDPHVSIKINSIHSPTNINRNFITIPSYLIIIVG